MVSPNIVATPSWAQNCSIVKPLATCRRMRSRQSAWSLGLGFLPSGGLLEMDELVQVAGYQAWQDWLSRTLTARAGP